MVRMAFKIQTFCSPSAGIVQQGWGICSPLAAVEPQFSANPASSVNYGEPVVPFSYSIVGGAGKRIITAPP